MDNIASSHGPVNTEKHTPQKAATPGQHDGSLKKRDRKKQKKGLEVKSNKTPSPSSKVCDNTEENVVINTTSSHDVNIATPTKVDDSVQVLQDKSNVEVKPSCESQKAEDKAARKERQREEYRKQKEKKALAEGGGYSATPPEGQVQKTKAQITAERRLKQEAQRAAKLEKQQAKAQSTAAAKKEPLRVPTHLRADDEAKQRKLAKKLDKQSLPQHGTKERHVQLFSHLFAHKSSSSLIETDVFKNCNVHPAIIQLGLLYSRGLICGSNARCISLLRALQQVIREYSTPTEKELSRDLEHRIRHSIDFLVTCRHLSVSMRNAIRSLKRNISLISPEVDEKDAKEKLVDFIDRYIKEKLYLAADAIFLKAKEKIEDDDVIIVYSGSSLVREILIDAKKHNKRFSVIVVDSRPRMEGKKTVEVLVKNGVECSYVLISAISYAMQKATKVFLGAHAALANGYIMSRAGTSLLCMMAKAYTVPVLVFCETHKFSERVQADSFVSNELADPDDLIHLDNQPDCLTDWKSYESLTLLNLVYDFTPPELITVVITELGTIPCSSIPVVLRVQQET
ncbi:translation initiation factor eIF-2B subunit delta [Octopus sinensis]|uniref:Translation initiation factor eIF2B subunit delta n=1 Tax=Octopus sinensis TaxID=2607531 RepID=A0A6P7TL24_9MOLL|nr:translation initiation factor eIF-2B subunit delta [Octopus sinensis]